MCTRVRNVTLRLYVTVSLKKIKYFWIGPEYFKKPTNKFYSCVLIWYLYSFIIVFVISYGFHNQQRCLPIYRWDLAFYSQEKKHFNERIIAVIVKVWVYKVRFNWNVCTKPDKWVVMLYVCYGYQSCICVLGISVMLYVC